MEENTTSSCSIVNTFLNSVLINNCDSDIFFPKSCKICSLLVKENVCTISIDSIEFNAKEVSLRNKLFFCCPELDLRINSKKTLCVNCFEIVNIINTFIRKCYTNTGQLNKNFRSNQNIYVLEEFSFVVKDEIKIEELDLYDTANSVDKRSTTTNKRHVMQKYNSKTDHKYCSRQNKDLTLFDTEEVSSKLLQSNKKRMPKSAWKRYLQLQTFKHSYNNFNKIPTSDCRQLGRKCTINKLYNYPGYECDPSNSINIGENPFKCSHCDYCSTNKSSLRYHILCTHTRKKPYKCSECDYCSKRKYHVIRHMLIHTGEKPFKCFECNYSSRKKNQLIRHSRIHTGDRPYKCSYCNYCSKRKYHLIRHIRTHTGEKPFKCFLCNYSSGDNGTLKCHLRTHTGEKPYRCSHCEYSSIDKSTLRYHLRTHTGEKPFKCFQCDYSSNSRGSLTIHTRIHTGEKPFKCLHCNYCSKQKYHLIRHIRTHFGKKLFKCSQCDFNSTNKHNLIDHVNNHTREKPFKRSQCEYE